MSAETPEHDQRPLVSTTCPAGHVTRTTARGGKMIKCGGCGSAGITTLIEVPLRPGETPLGPGHGDKLSLPLITVICEQGHGNRTQARGGTVIRCCVCAESGITALIAVPLRPGEEEMLATLATDRVKCAGCPAAVAVRRGETPPGWLSIRIAGGIRASTGRVILVVGPYCSIACMTKGARGLPGRHPAISREPQVRSESLMTSLPRGR